MDRSAKRSLRRQIEVELISAQNSVEFWRLQLPFHSGGPLKIIVERSLENALRRMQELEETKEAMRNA